MNVFVVVVDDNDEEGSGEREEKVVVGGERQGQVATLTKTGNQLISDDPSNFGPVALSTPSTATVTLFNDAQSHHFFWI